MSDLIREAIAHLRFHHYKNLAEAVQRLCETTNVLRDENTTLRSAVDRLADIAERHNADAERMREELRELRASAASLVGLHLQAQEGLIQPTTCQFTVAVDALAGAVGTQPHHSQFTPSHGGNPQKDGGAQDQTARDAERYRYIRASDCVGLLCLLTLPELRADAERVFEHVMSGKDMDAAIDAAILAAKGREVCDACIYQRFK